MRIKDVYKGVFDRGIAVGFGDIMNDEIVFRYRDETFEFPTIKVIHLTKHNGYFYEAKVESLRKLANGLRKH